MLSPDVYEWCETGRMNGKVAYERPREFVLMPYHPWYIHAAYRVWRFVWPR